VTGDLTALHNEKPSNLYSSNIIDVSNSKRMRSVVKVTQFQLENLGGKCLPPDIKCLLIIQHVDMGP